MSLEEHFDTGFTARLALREKQIQQVYRPIIGVHKWFARRPGTVFRNLLLSEYNASQPVSESFWRGHRFDGVIADPFMGGGTTLYEATRLGFSVVGCDVNPMATWIVRQSLAHLDIADFQKFAAEVVASVGDEVAALYNTACGFCGEEAPVKYFLWVKTQRCPACGLMVDVFPGYLLAEAVRHPQYVVACSSCGSLNEYENQPTADDSAVCRKCASKVVVRGPARRNRVECGNCGTALQYPPNKPIGPPEHRLWAIEYHCQPCKPRIRGRFFKAPDGDDLARFASAVSRLRDDHQLLTPDQEIPAGDETKRLHRWGYRRYREMFNSRQLLSLGLLMSSIRNVPDQAIRHALLTVFSDFIRYQNMLCRYDTYALKCQDIFSVHGFPVGLVQCENNVLGIENVGSGGFRHFVDKYVRAKSYCASPFETDFDRGKKRLVHMDGEKIESSLVESLPGPGSRQAYTLACPASEIALPSNYLDGVFTDPPYFDNVQYAELIDFCYVWLRLALKTEFKDFRPKTTRNLRELTGNTTTGKDLEHFTEGLSKTFRRYADALKPSAPFVFTFHHNDPSAYIPLVVSILDAEMVCTKTLPAPAEMAASLHIAGTGSSIFDSVFVCRRDSNPGSVDVDGALTRDMRQLSLAGIALSEGDLKCLLAGHVARVAVNRLWRNWKIERPLSQRMEEARLMLMLIAEEHPLARFLPCVTPEKTPTDAAAV